MPRSTAELEKAALQARKKIERKGVLIRLANKRIGKWERKRKTKKKGTLAYARCQRKLTLWKQRKHDAIYLRNHWRTILSDVLSALEKRQGTIRLLRWAEGYIGTTEGSQQQREWAENVNASASWPWCSIFVANGLLDTNLCTKAELPANPAYSGAWLAWSKGKRVPISERKPGDIVIFDWGDGGMTDHVAIVKNSGYHVGGNQSDAVNERPTPLGAVVAVIRVRT